MHVFRTYKSVALTIFLLNLVQKEDNLCPIHTKGELEHA